MSARIEGVGFGGPTLSAVSPEILRHASGVRWLPPVRRGDVDSLIDAAPPQLMIIVDGQFQHCLSVAHREILRALDAGWEVWGLASMGAIRAYELRDFGMLGFGQVYRRFETEDDFRDDEVALVHESEPPFRTLSEPLIHMRVALDDLVARRALSPAGARRVVETLASEWFGKRTLARLGELVVSELPPGREADVRTWLAGFDRYRIKSRDVEDFIASGAGAAAARVAGVLDDK